MSETENEAQEAAGATETPSDAPSDEDVAKHPGDDDGTTWDG